MSDRDFFDAIVKPTADEFLSDTNDVRRGHLAAITLYHMKDYYEEANPSLTPVVSSLIRQCPEFRIIQDVANAVKHSTLRQGARTLSSARQVRQTPGLFQAPFGRGVFAEAQEVEVTLNDGSVYSLASVVQAVLTMWAGIYP